MGTFLPFPAVAGVNNESDIDEFVHATAKISPGTILFYREGTGDTAKMSVVKYYKAASSIPQGVALVHDEAASVNPNQLAKASTSNAGQLAAGIAAAAVSNTGYYSFCYIYGYCPAARVGTAVASGVNLTIAATNNGLGALSEATVAATSSKMTVGFARNHFANTDAATNSSITINAWLG